MAGLTRPRCRPAYWSARAISAAQIGALALVPAAVADHGRAVAAEHDGHAGVVVGVGRHVGHPPGGPDAGDAVLVAGPGEQAAEPAAGCLEGRSRVAGRQAPGGLALPGAGGVD